MIKQAHKEMDYTNEDETDEEQVPHDTNEDDVLLREAQSLKVSDNTLANKSNAIPVKRTTSLSSLDSHHRNKKQKVTREDLSSFVNGLAYGIELKKSYAQEAKTNKNIETELEVKY